MVTAQFCGAGASPAFLRYLARWRNRRRDAGATISNYLHAILQNQIACCLGSEKFRLKQAQRVHIHEDGPLRNFFLFAECEQF